MNPWTNLGNMKMKNRGQMVTFTMFLFPQETLRPSFELPVRGSIVFSPLGEQFVRCPCTTNTTCATVLSDSKTTFVCHVSEDCCLLLLDKRERERLQSFLVVTVFVYIRGNSQTQRLGLSFGAVTSLYQLRSFRSSRHCALYMCSESTD